MYDPIIQPETRKSLDRLAEYAKQYASEQRELDTDEYTGDEG